MKRTTAAVAAASLVLFGRTASAHRIDEYLQATLFSLEANRVHASMRLIPGVLVSQSVIESIDSNRDGSFSQSEERAYAQRVLSDLSITFDGKSVQPELVSWSFPPTAQMREGLGEIAIRYGIKVPDGGRDRTLVIANHHLNRKSVYLMNVLIPQDPGIRILTQKRDERQSFYELDYRQASRGAGSNALWSDASASLRGVQFSRLFRLGIHHIAEGTDHLLFLLVLLLPAPLIAAGFRWGVPAGLSQSLLRILGIVTAFTIGHSITLSLAVVGAIKIPSRPVEVLIAVSIFVSAAHALRPIFPGREAVIAALFGLIHGLAFAATLDRLGWGRWERAGGILAFNLGIEVMQMLVVAAILPSLILMSRTRAYPVLRTGGALFAGAASVGWMAERLLDIHTPVDTIVNVFARHGLVCAISLFLVSLACKVLLQSRVQPSALPVRLTSLSSTATQPSDRFWMLSRRVYTRRLPQPRQEAFPPR